MICVLQCVTESSVTVASEPVGRIGAGLLVLLGIAGTDRQKDADYLLEKIIHLRVFEDEKGRMNRSLLDVKGEMLVVSQFTLLADCRKGRRPSFVNAAAPEKAEALYTYFVDQARSRNIPTATGRFRSLMEVALINQGPRTFILESR
jgi:D-tyrosyl-tRNA(Tyr) deacylase